MSTVTSYSLLSRPATSRLRLPHPDGKHVAAALAVAPLPLVRNKPPPRRLLVCHAADDKRQYTISPFALVHPKFPPTFGEHWDIKEEEDRIVIKLYVSPSTKDKLVVRMKDNVLLIKHKGEDGGGSGKTSPASLLDVRLLMPFSQKQDVKAALVSGWLVVTVPKPGDDSDHQIPMTTDA